MDYPEALRFLDRFVNREATAGRIHGLSLDAMWGLVTTMGNPQVDLRAIHVTGTNGKGSVVGMAGGLLTANGLRVGEYTSPHVDTIRERLSLGGEMITEDEFGDLIGGVAHYAQAAPESPSYFELLTAAALLWFSSEAVDAALVEVGLLGRFDATNVVDATVVVVTNVGRDHTDGRGEWRRAVAGEKAGIVVEGHPLVLGEPAADVRDLFVSEGAEPVLVRGEDFGVENARLAVGGQVVSLWGPHGHHREVYLPMYGPGQADNAAAALTAVEAFLGGPLGDDVVAEGLGGISLPGRMEVLARRPLVVADGAHNKNAAHHLASAITEAFTWNRLILVLGVLDPHDPTEIIDELSVLSPEVVVTCTAPSGRAVPVELLAAAGADRGWEVEAVSDPTDAVARAVGLAGEDDLVLVAGTFYIVSPARRAVSALGVHGGQAEEEF